VHTPDVSKESVIRFRADADDRRRLDALAAHYAVTPSTLLRMLLKKEHDDLVRREAPEKKKKR
jgi:antitoxin component of RelBE/YafQ-DinJ toxin-antitoxin module